MTNHVIRQQHLQVELDGSEADGLALQRILPRLCRNWMAPAMEAAFERCAPPDMHLVIDRLEIDAGLLPMEHLERDLARSVASALEKSLGEQIRRGQLGESPERSIRERSREDGVQEAFCHFLECGVLPWWFRLPPGKSLQQVVTDGWISSGNASGTPPAVGAVVRALASPTARKRLIRQFPLLLDTLLAVLSPKQYQALQEILEIMKRAAIEVDLQAALHRELWELSLAAVAAAPPQVMEETSGAFRALAPAAQEKVATILNHQWPEQAGKLIGRKSQPAQNKARRAEQAGSTPAAEVEAKGREDVGDAHSAALVEAKEGIYIDNAGAVLLHPFLPLFFETVGLALEGRLQQPERALCLLHFVVTGQAVAPEYELPLLKILCGIDLDTPTESDVALTDPEQAEAEELLRSVIGHWEALRNTSTDGLRGTFLLRPGKLTLREDGDWLLQVEPQACDILLDELPWGVSMVKLPWMQGMMWVEWR